MPFSFTKLLSVGLMVMTSHSTAAVMKRAANNSTAIGESFSLYAYGDNGISGLPLIYADGLAYVGYAQPEGAATVTNVTFAMTSSAALVTSPNNTANGSGGNVTLTSSPLLYVVPTSGSFVQVGFTTSGNSTTNTSSSTAPSGAQTSFFGFYGQDLFFVDTSSGSSTADALFWARETNTTGLYSLIWNSDGALLSDSYPITLKTTSPPSV